MKNKNKLGLILGFFFGFIFILTCTSVLNSETKDDSSAAGLTVVTYEKKGYQDEEITIDVPGQPVSIQLWVQHESHDYWEEAYTELRIGTVNRDRSKTEYNPSNGTLVLGLGDRGNSQYSMKYVILCKES